MDLDKKIDKIKDPVRWFDIVAYKYYIAGQFGDNIPVDWGRERFEKFLKKYKK